MDAHNLDLTDQLMESAEALVEIEALSDCCGNLKYRPRKDQLPVLQKFAAYLMDIATRPEPHAASPCCRIVLPPRTGKTVIAGHIITLTGLPATIVVPTRTLVLQTVEALGCQLSGSVPIGLFYGDDKRVVKNGINVITYSSLQGHSQRGTLPRAIARSALVFVDEAHHSMTRLRQTALNTAFSSQAVRIALTATPTYNDAKRVDLFFPDKIHEIDLKEAMALGLLAPARVWVAEVDAGKSKVRIFAGDFERELLGRIMSSAPFFKTVEIFRYAPENRDIPCLIVCASRQQAHDLHSYLKKHRPGGCPPPGLILGETPGNIRTRLLDQFEGGKIDTLIQVNVLIEGWNSPHCKLLIDLSPSTSRVRATQKYFRVMTRFRQKQARIYVILPNTLPRPPVLPMDLLFESGDEYICGELLDRRDRSAVSTALDMPDQTPVKGVMVKKKIVVGTRLELPRLKPGNMGQVRLVIESCPDFNPADPCIRKEFIRLMFNHHLFAGSGKGLLNWFKIGYGKNAYWMFMAKLYPEVAGHVFLTKNVAIRNTREQYPDHQGLCSKDVDLFNKALVLPAKAGKPEDPFPEILRMFQGCDSEQQTPETLLLLKEQIDHCSAIMERMDPRTRQIVRLKFGLEGEVLSNREIADFFDISYERLRQILFKSFIIFKFHIEKLEKHPLKFHR